MLVDRKNLKRHSRWLIGTLTASLAAGGWYLLAGQTSGRWPGGSSWPGMVFGSVAGGIILFEFLLWPRKWIRAWRIGSAQFWLRAHIWLGLLSVPLVVLHTGFTFGGSFTSVFLWVYLIVIASGVFGLAMQQFLPRMLLDQVPAETIASQIDLVSGQLAKDAEDLVTALCGRNKSESPTSVETVPEERSGHVVIGAVRRVGRTGGRVLMTQSTQVRINAPALRQAFDRRIKPYLVGGAAAEPVIADRRRASQWFDQLQSQLGDEAGDAVNALAGWCEQRRQFDLQRRLQFWLHAWLNVHLPLSVILVLLLGWHVVTALRYW